MTYFFKRWRYKKIIFALQNCFGEFSYKELKIVLKIVWASSQGLLFCNWVFYFQFLTYFFKIRSQKKSSFALKTCFGQFSYKESKRGVFPKVSYFLIKSLVFNYISLVCKFIKVKNTKWTLRCIRTCSSKESLHKHYLSSHFTLS